MTAEEERWPDRPDDEVAATPLPLEQAFDPESLYALRAAVAAHAAAAGLSRRQVYDVTAVAHELAANAVVHGAGHGLLRLWTDGGCLYCEVRDDGPAAPAAGTGESWPAEHGHGLWLARQIADQVNIDYGPVGTTARVCFLLARD